ncbi:uncharacterized protein TNCV_4848771 [Trichonephila clavipes]|nr:uncharacterized protein TNCV_4848771 [Trichonephila clavipes]
MRSEQFSQRAHYTSSLTVWWNVRDIDFAEIDSDGSRHPETMARRKGLSRDEIAYLLQETPENESDGGELSCFNLDFNEDIRLSESDCEESEESADIIDNIPVNPDIYVAGK